MLQRVARGALLCGFLLGATQSFAFVVRPDIHGFLQNNIYTNNIMNFSIKFPEEWKASIKASDLQPPIVANNSSVAISDQVRTNGTLLFHVSAQPGEELIANVYQLDEADKSTLNSNQQILEQIKLALLRATKMKDENISAIEQTKLGGLYFASMQINYTNADSKKMTETLYATKRNDYVLFFTSIYNTPAQAQELQNTFNTMLFY